MRLIKYISLILIGLNLNQGYSQWTGTAYELYKSQKFEDAKIAIDSAINSPERFDSQTWQLRGLIYRSISDGDQLYYRGIAMESFIHAKKLDSTGVYTTKINDYLKHTVLRYYNDAVKLLNEEKEFDKAEESYLTYKKHYLSIVDPNFIFDKIDSEFYNAMGVEYLNKAEDAELNKKINIQEKSIFYCLKSLETDSLNYQANFNIGIVYYTIAVDFITNVDPEITIEQLMLNQKRAEDAFLKGIPYLKKCEQMNPTDINVLIALMGCYYGLNNEVEYLKYQTIVDLYYLDSYIKIYKENPKDKENLKTLVRIYMVTLPNKEEAEKYRNELHSLQDE